MRSSFPRSWPVLFPLIPRVNTNPIAHRLLARFGNLHGVFTATIEQLEEVEGIGHSTALYMHATGKMFGLARGDGFTFYPQTFHRASFLAFMKTEYEWIPFEVLDVFFLNANYFIKKRYRYSLSNAQNVSVQLEELAVHMKEEKPCAVVLVHNHPSGDPSPTPADNEATALCRSLCESNGVMLCDHFIYSSNGTFSYYNSGALSGEILETSEILKE